MRRATACLALASLPAAASKAFGSTGESLEYWEWEDILLASCLGAVVILCCLAIAFRDQLRKCGCKRTARHRPCVRRCRRTVLTGRPCSACAGRCIACCACIGACFACCAAKVRVEKRERRRGSDADPSDWEEHIDDETGARGSGAPTRTLCLDCDRARAGDRYWHNPRTGATSWSDPLASARTTRSRWTGVALDFGKKEGLPLPPPPPGGDLPLPPPPPGPGGGMLPPPPPAPGGGGMPLPPPPAAPPAGYDNWAMESAPGGYACTGRI